MGLAASVVYTVGGALDAFRAGRVDLRSDTVTLARTSRDYLIDQLERLFKVNQSFPPLIGRYRYFGSFARRTKTKPLDDIDLMMVMHGGQTREVLSRGRTCNLICTTTAAPLMPFADGNGVVSSERVLNRVRNTLGTVANYQAAERKRDGQAVVLNLRSYSWSFDIVPTVEVGDGYGRLAHYLIPDGEGRWTRTDPRLDAQYATETNAAHSGQFLPLMRLLKYWNGLPWGPRVSSYYLEAVAYYVLGHLTSNVSLQVLLVHFFEHAGVMFMAQCPDPKGLGDNLDAEMSLQDKLRAHAAATTAAGYAKAALTSEKLGHQRSAIECWGKIFGAEFPQYGQPTL